ncbi:MAG: thiamine pyrophosphate-dependent enzyme [Dysgonamonadaceae bacterium]|nr:thiamine pyrophosphate-dependent enzyme [Dysgonamonadaceae bacterium]MDD3356362.1 thiamine pyrophosphate-dependent enzyme [Dysgonamonadaceae bacterium]MDD4246277.1 thiamine pyrophosphate-dependent enzyme [Dysgonamonadaceae bacterium]MDD4605347.1 thiamine pyrophosphate-dependent enzyme [Dysgonamonadaceae bacterium]
MNKNVSDQLVETLVDAGIQRIYSIAGDSLNHVNAAIHRNGKIKWIHVRHEETAAFAAGAEAQLNGLACCAGSSGPGHVHLINGLYDAHRSSASVLAIASTIATNEFGTGFFQETNTIKLFDDCSCYNQIATTPAQFPRMLQAALQHAVHKKGVAVIGLPGDITDLPAIEAETTTTLFRNQPVIRPSEGELQKLAKLLNSHKKITIFCGLGASEAHKEIIQLAEKLKAPIAYSYRAKMAIQHDNPYEVGLTGLLGVASAYHAMHDCELLVLLGTDFPYTPFMPVKNKIVQIDIKPEILGRRAKLDLGLCGDVKDTLQALLPLLEVEEDTDFLDLQLEFYQEVKKNLQTYVEDPGKPNEINPEFVASMINDLAAKDAIFTVDTGMCNVWAARYIDGTGKRKMLGSFNHGSMANAMPQAIGAALARPDQQVIAFCGDGGLSMMLGDLMTIVQYQLPVKIIAFNNQSLGMIKLEMQVAGIPDLQTDMLNPDFVKVAEAMGILGIGIDDPDDLKSGLERAFMHEGPVLVSIQTDPNALAMPPKLEFDQMKGFALYMGRMMLSGRMDEVFKVISSNYKHLGDVF